MSYLDDYLRADDEITIIRGTTPTIMINIDGVQICDISVLHISFAQDGNIILLKKLEDCEISDTYFSVFLSQEDTLSLSSGRCSVQARLLLKQDNVNEDKIPSLATNSIKINILDVQEDGVIKYE